MASVIRQGLCLLLVVLSGSALASPVWYSDAERLGRVELSNGSVSNTQLLSGIRQLAATPDGSVWVLTAHEVVNVSSVGAVRSRTSFASLAYEPSRASVSVDAYDDSAWLLLDSTVVLHLNAQGQLTQTLALPFTGQAIAVGLDQSLWIATPRQLMHLSSNGEPFPAVPLASAWTGPAKALLIDSIGGRAWLEGANSLAVIDLLKPNASLRTVSLGEPVIAGTLDQGTGFLWILTDKALVSYDGQLSRQSTVQLDDIGAAGSSGVSYDAPSGNLVLTSPKALSIVSTATPEPSPVAELLIPVVDLSTVPFAPRPLISLEAPLTTGSLIDTHQGIILRYAAGCPDIPCRASAAYFGDLALEAGLNGHSIASLFGYDASRNVASSKSAVPWLPGRNVLSVQLTDRFGHTSDGLTAQFFAGAVPGSTSSTQSRGAQSPGSQPTRAAAVNSSAVTQAIPLGQQGGQSPTVTLTAPTNGATFTAGGNITLTASASEAGGTIASVAFYRGGTTLIGTATASPYTLTWSNVPAGSYSLTAVATDTKRGSTTSAAVNISVVSNIPPTVALTAPTSGSIFAAGTNVSLTATASDPDDSVAKVDFYVGSTRIGTSTSSPYGVTWSNVALGSYSITAVATDSRGATTTSAAVAVTVVATPLVVVTSPVGCSSVMAPASLTLKADAVSPGGSISKVDFYQGSTLLGTSTSAPFTFAWNNVPQGTYSLTAKATDANGLATLSSAASVTVTPPDAPPTVSITAPTAGASFGVNTAVTVIATASDSDGTVTRVDFYADGGPIGTATASPYTVSWTPSVAGTHSLTAKATDNAGLATTSSAVSITILADAPPTVSITAPTAGASFSVGSVVPVTATASDSDGTVTSVAFYANGTLIGTVTAAPYAVNWTASPAGTYSLTAVAKDNAGLSTTSAAVSITVTNIPPSVSITSPSAGAQFIAPATITITATASDSDSTIARVDFYADGALIGTATGSPYTVTWTTSVAGPHSLTAKATDNVGLSTTSSAVSVSVVPDAPPTVSITAPTAGASFGVGVVIPVTATASDSDGTVTQVAFYAGGVLIGTATAAPYSANWTPTAAGTYSLTAIATDNASLTTTSVAVSVTIAADPPPSISLTEPLPGSTSSAGRSITLAASASSSSSTIARVDFYANGTAVASATSSPFIATWSNVTTGNYQLTAVATDGLGVKQTSAAVSISVIGPAVTITAPQSGATITGNSMLVSGSITAPPNSGVNINGVAAELDDSNNFYLTVPLASGSNSLTVTLYTPDGYTTSQTLTVTSSSVTPFLEVTPSTLEGISPLTVSFTAINHSATSASVQFNGGSTSTVAPGGTTTFTLTLTGAQSVSEVVSATDGSGNSASASYMVVVHDPAGVDQKMSSIFNSMNNSLKAGDKTSALSLLSASAQTIYGPVFDALIPSYASIAASFSPLQRSVVTDVVAEYAINRTISGVNQIFFIYFIKDPDGIWRLEAM